jgi:hypothetical protein
MPAEVTRPRDTIAPMRGGAKELSRVLRSPGLRRVEGAFLGFGVAEYGVWTAMLVYAYGRGGTTTAAVVAVLQLAPAAVIAPFAASLTDTHGGAFALRLGYALQAVAMAGAAAVLLGDGPAPAAYAMAMIAAAAVTVTRPAQAAVLVALVESPRELTAATVVSGWVESASVLVGPGLAGVLLGVGGPGAAFMAFAGVVTGSMLLVAPVAAAPPSPGGGPADRLGGLRALRAARSSQALVAVLVAEYVAIGALDVLVVVLAIAALGLGPSGAGYLTAAFGAGGVAGGALALVLIGARSVALPLVAAAGGWAAALAVRTATRTAAAAYALLFLAGTGRIVLETAGRTLLARVTPPAVLGRVFGVLEALSAAALATGSLLVPVLVGIGGLSLAIGGVAGLLAVAAVALLPRLRALDRAVPAAGALRILHGHEIFAGLSAPVLEGLTRELAVVTTRAGEGVVRQGEPGDRFYLIADGQLDVWKDGERVGVLGPGDGFGEIALLRGGPRRATVVAREAGLLYGLGREPFLEALATAV